MKYAGMPMGMWMLFAGSFQKQLTAYVLSLVVVVLQNFYSLLDNCIRSNQPEFCLALRT